MNASSPLTVRATSVAAHGIGVQWLVELTCPRPVKVALAIVLDLSDSCGAMRNETSKFARLIAQHASGHSGMGVSTQQPHAGG